jgi:hypothetical protein
MIAKISFKNFDKSFPDKSRALRKSFDLVLRRNLSFK